MSALSLREIARATGGEVHGRQVLAPGPGHRPIDRSLSIRLSAQSPTGFIVHTFSGHDFREARDHVTAKLGFPFDVWKRRPGGARPTAQPEVNQDDVSSDQAEDIGRIVRARALWNGASDAHGTIVETYLAGRGLSLDLVSDRHEVIRFHARTPWKDEARAETIYVPAMIACMRSISNDTITAIHRTRLTPEGVKVDRRMLGIARAAAVKLDADDVVTHGLAIGEGVESCLAARALGFAPVWAVASAGAVASFPVLGGIEALTLLAENDPASDRAIGQCAERWHAAGREVTIITPNFGSDLADVIGGGA